MVGLSIIRAEPAEGKEDTQNMKQEQHDIASLIPKGD
jgi:hypothetical protein